MATYTTDTGITYASADKIAISLIENPPQRTLTKSEKDRIATYMARPASERAAIELDHLGYQLAAAAPPTTEVPGEAPTPPTTPPPTAPPTGEYKDWSHLATFGTRLEQQVEAYTKEHHTSFSFDKSGIKAYLDKIGATDKTRSSILQSFGQFLDAQASYQAYLEYYPTVNAPAPKDFTDYLANFEEWMTGYGPEAIATERQREYDAWWRYARKYGTPGDWRPVDIDDFFSNYDKAQGLLTEWQGMAEEEEVEFSDEQVREWNTFKAYASQHGEITDWFPVSIEDYFANYDQAQQQLGTWQERAAAVEPYEVDPEEAARRREEAYEEGRYAAKERYREPPMYQEAFAGWLGQQGQLSSALQEYTERQYPSLRAEYGAEAGRLTGFPTREAARAEAARREQGWQAWLTEKRPEVREEYYAQRPAQRGERLWMQRPTVRAVAW